MPDKIKLEYVAAIMYCKCACVGDDWEEEYKDNPSVISLISKLLSAESDKDEGVEEAMEELIMQVISQLLNIF